ncbi:hypothetical protein ADICYQ_0311 [Cyclobacterium qasimii M12-11B]|uniref:Uncharacterized protein n=1 Tax=Cyclobacterium qasimii M12-11B TaxID=641524 RepID=S7VQ66_9BACT|nr:hypothetical protein ADICYQ_0311 [Cyclobacterium qasimii M12-11B]
MVESLSSFVYSIGFDLSILGFPDAVFLSSFDCPLMVRVEIQVKNASL